jgi:hypothetical protein
VKAHYEFGNDPMEMCFNQKKNKSWP